MFTKRRLVDLSDNLSSKGEPAGFKRAHSGEAESDGDTDLAAGSPLEYTQRVVDAERERIAVIIEGLDNTMMHQTKLAAHIRERR